MLRNVVVIIPVYADWPSLEVCLDSLKRYLAAHHKVILVNDCGPEADWLEKKILSFIHGLPNYQYYSNSHNLGFVKTCNRAVLELNTYKDHDVLLLNSDTRVTEGFLEEMLEVLYSAEKHGVVCPRSNNASILSVPFPNQITTEELSYKTFLSYRDSWPRYTIIPTGVGFCILIRRELIANFGLFDEIYGKGYNEENDFCMRISEYGYSCIMANHAFVFHIASVSFGNELKAQLDSKNHKILIQRYSYYSKAITEYVQYRLHPLDHFSSVLYRKVEGKKSRILFNLLRLPAAHNGTSEYNLNLLKLFYERFKEKYEMTVLVNRMADKYHSVSIYGPNIIYPDQMPEQKFELAFTPSQIFYAEDFIILNNMALKLVFTMQDIIVLRCTYLNNDQHYNFKMISEIADGLIFISEYSYRDYCKYFAGDCSKYSHFAMKVIYHGVNQQNDFHSNKVEVAFDQYILILGNAYKHKAIESLLGVIKDIPRYNFIIIGGQDGYIQTNIFCIKSGKRSDDEIAQLYRNAQALIFPSFYEGFGLPLINYLKWGGKRKIFAHYNELNQELMNNLLSKQSEAITLFHSFNELKDLILREDFDKVESVTKFDRSWLDVAIETERFLDQVIKKDIDVCHLEQRWSRLKERERCGDPRTVIHSFQVVIKALLKRIFHRVKCMLAGI
ncbi:MAG: glycosyltransferase [Gammaproteobacteria bacterium]|nr:glycosyltransferase [Gammaproteobacteria bacterium]